jgi:hypothetical protein
VTQAEDDAHEWVEGWVDVLAALLARHGYQNNGDVPDLVLVETAEWLNDAINAMADAGYRVIQR